MKIIKLSEDELSDYDLEQLDHNRPLDVSVEEIIYYYKNYGYEGYGVILYLDNKGGWHLDTLGHCSCYGPIESFNRICYSELDVDLLLQKRVEEEYGDEQIYKKVLDAFHLEHRNV